ncbi:hypothetical protein EDB87DRAFT_1676842 [Lactarius vividus]|nr:hypothetical protein EDB87DRAFT_1676842 [Lactarius vividus]
MAELVVQGPHTPDKYERTSYYNGITGDGDYPELVYRSDFLTTPFPKPVGRHANIPIKSLRGVFDTPLNGIWDTVGLKIRDLIKARKINWSSIDPARFFTHGPLGEKGSLGPIVIWVGVIPSSTSSDTAHEVSQEILTLLLENAVKDAVVEWREAVHPSCAIVGSDNATHYVRRFLTALLGIPLVTKGMEQEDAQGTLTLCDEVYGVSNCHVLREDTTIEYEQRGGAPKDYVRKAIGDRRLLADLWAREIVTLRAKERQDAVNAKAILANRRGLEDEKEAIAYLEALYWSNINLYRDIDHVQYAAPITVDVEGGTLYTSDWAASLATEAKVKDEFEGNYSPPELMAMFYPLGGGATTFKFPEERKLRIEGCATKEDLAVPAEFDSESQRYLIVGRDGNATDLTVGRYAGLSCRAQASTTRALRVPKPFSDKGDSGSLVWYMTNGKARHPTTVTYCTPGWYLLDKIRKKFKYADFYRTT